MSPFDRQWYEGLLFPFGSQERQRAKEKNSQHYCGPNLISCKVKSLFYFSSSPPTSKSIIWHLHHTLGLVFIIWEIHPDFTFLIKKGSCLRYSYDRDWYNYLGRLFCMRQTCFWGDDKLRKNKTIILFVWEFENS